MSTDIEFDAAVAAVAALRTDPGNQAKLALYGLYKQATAGDVTGGRPGLINVVGRAKYDAWATHTGIAPDGARRQYVALVRRLQAEQS